MKLNLRSARTLCTAKELELVMAGSREGLRALSEARLKLKVVRARNLRDKYRDLLRRQRLAARRPGAKPARDDANARTESKVALFEQTLARFVDRLAQVQAAAKKPVGKKPVARKAVAKKAAASKPAAPKVQRSAKAPAPITPLAPTVQPPPARGFVSDKAAQSARNVRLKSINARNVQAHVSARGRRNQAKRDSRPR
ncbi:MAG: hypothetical protein IPM30_06795 [Burkholderiales bacterium]|nr:hypothetical protein [Burkholderiales bacterium]